MRNIFKKESIKCGAVLVAAGSSSRMNGMDKIIVQMKNKPVIAHTVLAFQQNSRIDEIVIVTRQELLEPIGKLCREYSCDKVKMIVSGGATRPESVMKGLDQLSKDVRYAAIHDGARPLVSQEIINCTLDRAAKFHAAAPAVPVKDTIKIAKNKIVTSTPDRSTLFAIQTPQIFDFDLLRGALQKAIMEHLPITDDCSAVEAIGMSVSLSEGSYENIKITTPIDLAIAEAILEERKRK